MPIHRPVEGRGLRKRYYRTILPLPPARGQPELGGQAHRAALGAALPPLALVAAASASAFSRIIYDWALAHYWYSSVPIGRSRASTATLERDWLPGGARGPGPAAGRPAGGQPGRRGRARWVLRSGLLEKLWGVRVKWTREVGGRRRGLRAQSCAGTGPRANLESGPRSSGARPRSVKAERWASERPARGTPPLCEATQRGVRDSAGTPFWRPRFRPGNRHPGASPCCARWTPGAFAWPSRTG